MAIWKALLVALAAFLASADCWRCDVVSEGRIECVASAEKTTTRAVTSVGVTSAVISCPSEEDASDLLTEISKEATAVLDDLEVVGCSLDGTGLRAQVPVKSVTLRSVAIDPHTLQNFPLMRMLKVVGQAEISDYLCSPRLPKGLKVDLSDNDINVVPSCPDGETSPVVQLNLSANRVGSLPANMLSGFGELRELLLADNDIETIDAAALAALPKLRSLDVGGNRLASLPNAFVDPPAKLKKLALGGNLLGCFPDRFFASLTELAYLDLSSNLVTEDCLISGALADTGNIVLLSLAGNKLSSLPDGSLRGLEGVRRLDISENAITAVGGEALSGLDMLEDLSLEDNRLSSFDLSGLASSAGNTLKKLDLSANAILKLNVTASKANMTALEELNLSDNKLQILEATTQLPNLRKLVVDNNEIFRISLPKCTKLQELVLKSNRFTKMPGGMQALENLAELDLSLNLITSVERDAFDGLVRLRTLRLEDNSIAQLSDLAFRSTSNLEILNLSGNFIANLTGRTFEGAESVKALRLDSNSIGGDLEGVFHPMEHLTWLNMSNNEVEAFDWHYVPYSLRWLDLSSNRLQHVRDFYDLRSQLVVQTLDLSHNQLRRISPSAVPDSVAFLSLNVNQIKEIDDGAFADKTALRKLDLYANQLVHLRPSQIRFHALSKPEVYLGGNPLACDCELQWLAESDDIDIRDLSSIYCHSARSSAFVALVEADPKRDFLCPYRQHCFSLCHCCQFDACDCHMACPDGCRCYRDQAWTVNVVDCSLSRGAPPPQNVPMDATEVVLAGNRIPVFTKRVLIGRTGVRKLFLNNSGLEAVAEEAFVSLTKLDELHLENNLLETLRPDAFETQGQLRSLFLQYNRLVSLSEPTLRPLVSLEYLRLDHNFLQTLAFWYLPSDAVLNLEENPWNCTNCVWTARAVANIATRTKVIEGLNNTCLASTKEKLLSLCPTITDATDPLTSSQEVVLAVALSCALVGIALLAAAAVFCYRSKENLALVLYTRFGLEFTGSSGSDTSPSCSDLPGVRHDALIIYNTKDSAWIEGTLSAELEQCPPYYSLVLPQRTRLRGADTSGTSKNFYSKSPSITKLLCFRRYRRDHGVSAELRSRRRRPVARLSQARVVPLPGPLGPSHRPQGEVAPGLHLPTLRRPPDAGQPGPRP